MTEKEFREVLSKNIAMYRQLNGLTQAELAECISYSDKSVSKWERAEGVPDAFTLLALSEVFDISLSELVGQVPKCKATAEKQKTAEKDKKASERAKKKAIERAKKRKRK